MPWDTPGLQHRSEEGTGNRSALATYLLAQVLSGFRNCQSQNIFQFPETQGIEGLIHVKPLGLPSHL